MKIRVNGNFQGEPAFLDWEDGKLESSHQNALNLMLCIAVIKADEGFPTPDRFIKLDDWMSHPRGFVLCAKEALDNASTDWIDTELPDMALAPIR
ncbi:MAG: hypothetical protein WC423_10245 [Vulcanimicrobiota bacterium]